MASTTPDVTVEGGAFGDIRFHLLTSGLGLQRIADAVGRHAWLTQWCKGKLTDIAPRAVVDMHLGAGGAEALVATGLAAELEDGSVHVTSATEEVERWRAFLVKSSRGGQNRASRDRERADNDTKPGLAPAAPQPQPSSGKAEPAADQGSTPAQLSVSVSVSGPVSEKKKPEKNPPNPPKGGSRSGISAADREVASRVLGHIAKRTGVAYQGADPHVRLIAACLREDGVTEDDLRKVIAFAWAPSGLDWQNGISQRDGKPMRTWLTPETLFGPKKLHAYLPRARAWFDEHVRPQLESESASRDPPPAAADRELAAIATPRLRSVP